MACKGRTTILIQNGLVLDDQETFEATWAVLDQACLANGGSAASGGSTAGTGEASQVDWSSVRVLADPTLSVRSRPDTLAEVVGTVQLGDTVDVTCSASSEPVNGPDGQSNPFWSLITSPVEGWVSNAFLAVPAQANLIECAEATTAQPIPEDAPEVSGVSLGMSHRELVAQGLAEIGEVDTTGLFYVRSTQPGLLLCGMYGPQVLDEQVTAMLIQEPLAWKTPEGIGRGSTVEELRATYPDARRESGVYKVPRGDFGYQFAVADGMVVAITIGVGIGTGSGVMLEC